MKNLLYASIILLAGCCTLNENYIRQDRKNYETLAPRIRTMLETTAAFDDAQKRDIEDRLQGWDAKSTQAMETLAE
jgi:hypothetical protein